MLKTSETSDAVDADESSLLLTDGNEQLADISLEEMITAFLVVNPTPKDWQIHRFASILGHTPEELEECVYSMFAELVNDDVDDDLIDEEEDEDEDEDPINTFLLYFFAYRPAASNEEIQDIAGLIGITTEDMEERLFNLLTDD